MSFFPATVALTTGSPAIGQSIIPEQRIKFAEDFENLFHDKAMAATVATHGDQQRIYNNR
jgi:hypothetical protein